MFRLLIHGSKKDPWISIYNLYKYNFDLSSSTTLLTQSLLYKPTGSHKIEIELKQKNKNF